MVTKANGHNGTGKRAVIYARVSSERQAGDDRVSIEAQLADCRRLCEERGYHILEEYVDKKNYRVRGKTVRPSGQRKDRPAYREMLEAARAGELDVIVAWKEDRLYRGMYAAMPLSRALDERGADLEVALVVETFDRKMLGIKAAMGKIELDNIRERTIMGRRMRLQRGEAPGGPVKYGYRKNEEKKLAIEEKEARIVRKVFEMRLEDESLQNMRKRLDATGITPRRGKRWSKATIQNILDGEFYATGEMKTTLDGEEFTIPCPPIIDVETWNKAEEVRARNKRYYRPRNLKEDYLCAGLVYCACGWKMRATTHGMSRRRPNKAGTLTGSYICPRQHTKPETVTAECAKSIGSQTADDYVWDYVRRICRNPTLVREALARRVAAMEAEQAGLEADIERLERGLEQLAIERQWVITQARQGAITQDDMELQLGQLQMQQWSHQKDVDERRSELTARRQLTAAQDWADNYLADIGAGLHVLELEPETLGKEEYDYLYQELQAWRYEEKFPDDRDERLSWAQLEERRRVVRGLITRVNVARTADDGRDIRPVLGLGIPLDELESLASGHQSLAYIEREESHYLKSLQGDGDGREAV